MSTENKVLARIAALLVQAEQTDNGHEADAFMTAAQRLATLNSIDLAKARNYQSRRTAKAKPVHRSLVLGLKRQRGLRTYVDLFGGIARANDVIVDVAYDATAVYLYGFDEDIAVTETLYGSLVTQMVSACEAFLATGVYRTELVERTVRVWDADDNCYVPQLQYVPVSKSTARLAFQSAFANRVAFRLQTARREAEAEVIGAESPPVADGAPGTALVLARKLAEVEDFYTAESTARGRYRGHQSATTSNVASRAGDEAGKGAQLTAATELPGAPMAISDSAHGA